jgi:hypothetical protein
MDEKDEAAYWYYTAQFRKIIFIEMQEGEQDTPASDISQALESFNALSGEWINDYAGDYLELLLQTLQRVIRECSQMCYMQHTYPFVQFKPEKEQALFVERIVENIEAYCKSIITNKDGILRQQNENGF